MKRIELNIFAMFCVAVLSACATTVPATPVPTNDASAIAVNQNCKNMLGFHSGVEANFEITLASEVTDRADLPRFCQLQGVIQDKIEFEMRIPTSAWNGKFVVAGCGGFCGAVFPDKVGYSNTINESLKLGYAAITTDSGHQAKSWETHWAVEDPQRLEYFARAWMPLAVDAGKVMLSGLFQTQPKRTYFSGCSNGGRLGFEAAQRYPDLFDGIAAGSGVFDFTGQSGIHGLWLLQATRTKGNQPVIDYKKLPLLEKAIFAQCDQLDGRVDDLIDDPRACTPDLSTLRCDADMDTSTCLTKSELGAIKKLYQGATIDGKQMFAGLPPGSEGLWKQWVVGDGEKWGWGELAVLGTLRLAYNLGSDDPMPTHDLVIKDELPVIYELGPKLNSTNADLSGLHAAGGKMIYYHGKADPLILFQRAEEYAEVVRMVLGTEKADETARFYMIPGFGHCWEEPNRAPDQFNPVVEIDRWVEQGIAPEYLDMAQKDSDGEVVRERRICSYPQVASFVSGDPDLAESYRCITPE